MRLYFTKANTADVSESVLFRALNHDRRIRIVCRPWADRIASAAASHLVRYALSDAGYAAYADAPIVWEGKPHFADPAHSVYFNLSHTVDRVNGTFAAAVLLSREGEVGVDIELPRPLHNREAMVKKIISGAERDYLSEHGEDAFFDLWCAKEAYMKWTGEGLSRPMSRISVDLAHGFAESDGRRCALHTEQIAGCHLVYAAEHIGRVETRAVTVGQLINFCKGEPQ